MKKVLLLSLVLLTFSNCGIGYFTRGKATTFEGVYELPSKGSIEKSMSKLKSVLYAEGWNKRSEDSKTLQFENTASAMRITKTEEAKLKADFSENGVKLYIYQHGNSKFGTEKAVNKTFAKIKEEYELN